MIGTKFMNMVSPPYFKYVGNCHTMLCVSPPISQTCLGGYVICHASVGLQSSVTGMVKLAHTIMVKLASIISVAISSLIQVSSRVVRLPVFPDRHQQGQSICFEAPELILYIPDHGIAGLESVPAYA
jgi:hypothetical protein